MMKTHKEGKSLKIEFGHCLDLLGSLDQMDRADILKYAAFKYLTKGYAK